MDTITFKVDKELAKAMKNVMKPLYATKTEFIREALRKHVKELEAENAINELKKLRGSLKKHVSDEELENIREKVFREYAKERGWKL